MKRKLLALFAACVLTTATGALAHDVDMTGVDMTPAREAGLTPFYDLQFVTGGYPGSDCAAWAGNVGETFTAKIYFKQHGILSLDCEGYYQHEVYMIYLPIHIDETKVDIQSVVAGPDLPSGWTITRSTPCTESNPTYTFRAPINTSWNTNGEWKHIATVTFHALGVWGAVIYFPSHELSPCGLLAKVYAIDPYPANCSSNYYWEAAGEYCYDGDRTTAGFALGTLEVLFLGGGGGGCPPGCQCPPGCEIGKPVVEAAVPTWSRVKGLYR